MDRYSFRLVGGLLSAAAISLALPATAALAEPPSTLVLRDGVQRLSCQSNWQPTESQAERECLSSLQRDMSSARSRLRSQGRRVTNETHGPVNCEERTSNDRLQFRCRSSSEIDWIDAALDADTPRTAFMVPPLAVAAMVAEGSIAQPGEEVQEPGPVIYIDDEMMSRFWAARGNRAGALEGTLRVERADVSIGNLINSMPQSVEQNNYVTRNFTDQPQPRHFDIGLQVTNSEIFRLSRTLTTHSSSTLRAEVTWTPANGGLGGSAGGERTTTRTLEVGSATENSTSRVVTHNENFDLTVPPRTELYIKLERSVSNDEYELVGNITVDGTVAISHRRGDYHSCGPLGTRRCHRTWTEWERIRLSDVLSREARTIDLGGRAFIRSSANTTTLVTFSERPLPTPSAAFVSGGPASSQFEGVSEVDSVPTDMVFRPVPGVSAHLPE